MAVLSAQSLIILAKFIKERKDGSSIRKTKG
jgi:hypothetical protein